MSKLLYALTGYITLLRYMLYILFCTKAEKFLLYNKSCGSKKERKGEKELIKVSHYTKLAIAGIFVSMLLSGCATKAGSGALIGAGAGGLAGAAIGGDAKGAALGAAAGAVTGAPIGNSMDRQGR